MGLFDKLKGKKETVDWSEAFRATPQFYEKPGELPFGAVTLTEGAETILPKSPQKGYQVDGKSVAEWKMVLVSISKNSVIGIVDYSAALKKVEKYVLDSDKDSILVRGLSLSELESLMR